MRRVMNLKGLVCALLWSATALGQTPFVVSPSTNMQQWPAVHNGVVIWQEYVQYNNQWDWDIYGVDVINAPSELIGVAAFEANQTHPSLWETCAAWEDDYYGDTDVWVSDFSDTLNITTHSISPYLNNQSFPRIHGNTVVWQHQIADPDTQVLDWDIYAADVTDPNNPLMYVVGAFSGDQQYPDIYRSTIVWQDNYWGDNDIAAADVWRRNEPEQHTLSSLTLDQTSPATDGKYVVWQEDFGAGDVDLYGADISNPDQPVELLISDAAGSQINASLSGHLVVWQDNRNGNWDIYGFNLITRQEFQITNDKDDQIHPAIDNELVVFEDDRSGMSAVYAVQLDGTAIADCTASVSGDANGDCRVDMSDLAAIASGWLTCGLEPIEACNK
ncbi:MAG: hypothetical protein ABFD91_15545 [Anaerohalosphaeraceae bacterium]